MQQDFSDQKEILTKEFAPVPVDLFVKSPGRFNLIGEHTDYNGGFVVPGCLDRHIFFGFQKCDPATTGYLVSIKPLGVSENWVEIPAISKEGTDVSKYVCGVIHYLKEHSQSPNKEKISVNIVCNSTLPIGAGVSSSAALCVGIAYGLNELYGLGLSKMDLALAANFSEHEYVGLKCGLMDQFIIAHGKASCVFKFDCRSKEFEEINTNSEGNFSIVLANTLVKHNLVESEYNKRRLACESVVAKMAAKLGRDLETLRDISLEELESGKDILSELEYKRAKYVLDENVRVTDMIKALQEKDWATAKQVMTRAHYGLKDMYEVSCPELDFLVKLTEDLDYVYGSRMMGGGFGGCTVSLVKCGKEDEIEELFKKNYKQEFGKEPKILRVEINDGVCKF